MKYFREALWMVMTLAAAIQSLSEPDRESALFLMTLSLFGLVLFNLARIERKLEDRL